ncbi:MAG TPA: hypothetical protein VD788_06420, partial [Candidatus Polarisedimenticolaceae bacterium]|nr:hypothetical protein [Candidatus Polarisedimenticolaceae bacterium]
MGEPVFVRYWLLQLPGQLGLFALMWLLQRWLGFAAWVPFVVVGVWAAKDLALYPLVRGAYATGDRLGAPRKLVGEAGAAEQDLAPSGYVRVRGEL